MFSIFLLVIEGFGRLLCHVIGLVSEKLSNDSCGEEGLSCEICNGQKLAMSGHEVEFGYCSMAGRD